MASSHSITRLLVTTVAFTTLTTGCAHLPPFSIENDGDQDVLLSGCAQEPELVRTVPAHGRFSFTDSVGDRVLSDDPGFSCLIRLSDGRLRCLRLPTDQTDESEFAVSESTPTESFSQCVAHSDPHL